VTELQRQSGAPNAEPTLATLGRPIATAAQQRQAPRLQPIPGHKRPSRHRQFPIGPPEPSARRTRDSVPWRFSDADQYRATTRASRHGVRETCTEADEAYDIAKVGCADNESALATKLRMDHANAVNLGCRQISTASP
jgi:hypothetical protein